MSISPVTMTMPVQKEVVTLADGRVLIPTAEAKRLSGEAFIFYRASTIVWVILIVTLMATVQMRVDQGMYLSFIVLAVALGTLLFGVYLNYQSHLFKTGQYKIAEGKPAKNPEATEEKNPYPQIQTTD
ncbi:hypothetical protein ACFLQ2_05215 [archaeon]